LSSDSYVSTLKGDSLTPFKETEIVGGMTAIQIYYVAHTSHYNPGITDKRSIRF
jgi:hypothetical protein